MLKLKQELVNTLSVRTNRVVALFLQGMTDKEIAGELKCSNEVVAYHLKKFMRRIEATNRSRIWTHLIIKSLLDEKSVDNLRRNFVQMVKGNMESEQ